MYKCNFFITFFLVILSLMFNSCKKDSSTKVEPKVSEACQLLSVAEAHAITGYTYTSTKTSENSIVGLKLCDYNNDDFDLFQIGLTQTAAIDANSGMKVAKEYYESMKVAYPGYTLVNGVGDEAIIANSFIYIKYTDDYYINIYISYSGLIMVTTKNNNLIAAGKKAVENLKKLL